MHSPILYLRYSSISSYGSEIEGKRKGTFPAVKLHEELDSYLKEVKPSFVFSE